MKKISFIICLVLIIAISGCGGGNSMTDEKVKMQEWLKEKYGKEFIVENVDYYTQYLGASKEIKGTAHPVDDEEIKFEIKKSADGKTYAPDGRLCFETYYKSMWESQYNKQLKGIINSEYITCEISAPYLTLDKEIKGKTLNLDEAKDNFNNTISVYLTYAVFDDLYNENGISTKELERIFSEIQRLKDDKFKDITLRIVYFSNNYKSRINKDSPFKFYTDGTYQTLKKNREIHMEVVFKNINEIYQYSDIEKSVEI